MLCPPAASRRRSIAVLGGGSLLGRAVVRAIAEKEKTCFVKVIQLDVNAILAEVQISLSSLDARRDELKRISYGAISIEYCDSKCIAEEMIKTIGREYCILRCGPIFGADDSSSVLTDLIWMSRFFGGCIPRIGDGEGFLQMTHAENVADIVLKTADKLLANNTAVTPKYYSSTPRCKKPVFLNLSAYSPVKKLDFANITADESKKAEREGDVEQAIDRKVDSKLDGSVEVARDSYAIFLPLIVQQIWAKFREGYQEFSLFGSFDDRDMLDYYESQLQGVLPAILYDSDDDIPGDTLSSGEFYESLSVVIEETEEEEESEQWSREEFEESSSELRTEQANQTHCQTLGCSKIERENENEEEDVAADGTEEEFDNDENDEQKAVIRKEIVLVADDTPKGNLFEVFDKVLQGKNDTRSTSFYIPFLPLYLLYLFLTSILQLINNTVYPLRDLHRAFSTLPHPNVFYLNFRHWTFFNTVKCNLLFGYTYKKSFEEAVATSLPHYNGMEPAHVQRFSWMPQEFNKHSHTKSAS
ncbi:hypothetical protein WR25_19828 [Diploscapter pachys]|uniref:3-beta hydroxysteroid dehydrogenase/isomerase domain-containing protein n=1 Tax=Diploscapter pachys TaxID=2018661 RepID=A0A2A2LAV6_9BILA|nr:hypothetical protein WR25_19828 [Diploscapter pachys]